MADSHGILTDRIWIDPVFTHGEGALSDFSRRLDVSEALGQILAARDLFDLDGARRFLNPSESDLHDPFQMAGMEAAVRRIEQAIDRFEKVLIFGDYDVDGTASAAILYNYLKRLGARVHYFIPDRMVDGYGLNVPTINKIKAAQADLIITVDNGSTALEESRYIAEQGIDLIVTDHHRMGEEFPIAVALVNPQRPDCTYPFKGLSAAGVAFKMVCALDRRLTERAFWDERGLCHTQPAYYLDLVALATVADMSPLTGENRVLVKLGLELMNARPRPGLAGLIRECNIRSGISPSTINFKIAPKINALGRIGDPRLGMQILLAHSYTEGRRLARHLAAVNRMRQEIERNVLTSAIRQVEECEDQSSYVLVGNDWHPGVIGIIATRIAYQYQRPTVVITLAHGDQALGSARGCGAVNVLDALASCESLLDRFGGHANAAGLALQPGRVGAFRDRFRAFMEESRNGPQAPDCHAISIETWIDADLLDLRFSEEIGRLSPFGFGNPEPVFGVRALNLDHPAVMQNRRLRFQLSGSRFSEDTVGWDQAEWTRNLSGSFDAALTPQVQYGPDGVRTHFRVLDLRSVA
jgi:single-stranded-DNA-specific exonuclease